MAPFGTITCASTPRHPFLFYGAATGTATFFWPTGLNIRSVNDGRGAKRTGSRLTPNRGWHAYQAYLQRLVDGGANIVEIWMSSWNLALEWRSDWPGYRGLGRYNQVNAKRLDQILDFCETIGMRVNLVIYNHGMASHKTDREWDNNPYNRFLHTSTADGKGTAQAGILNKPSEMFTSQAAMDMQDRVRRYIIARYADSPAIYGWKLWSEQNLTAGSTSERLRWHIQQATFGKKYDIYNHPVVPLVR